MTNNPGADSLVWPPPVQASIGSGSPSVGLPNRTTPAVRVYRTTAFNVLNNTSPSIIFTAKRFDTDNIFTSGTRLTCRTNGLYLITINFEWTANGVGTRSIQLQLNAVTTIAYTSLLATSSAQMTLSTIYALNTNDYIEAQAFQNSGGALDVLSVASYSPELVMNYIGAI
jgi:hypothetical protein